MCLESFWNSYKKEEKKRLIEVNPNIAAFKEYLKKTLGIEDKDFSICLKRDYLHSHMQYAVNRKEEKTEMPMFIFECTYPTSDDAAAVPTNDAAAVPTNDDDADIDYDANINENTFGFLFLNDGVRNKIDNLMIKGRVPALSDVNRGTDNGYIKCRWENDRVKAFFEACGVTSPDELYEELLLESPDNKMRCSLI